MDSHVHHFSTTGEARRAALDHDAIHDGDILVVPAEGVIAIVYHGHSCAITHATGAFGRLDADWLTVDSGAYAHSFGLALLEQDRRMRAVIPRVVIRLRAGERVRDVVYGRTGTILATYASGSIVRVRWKATREPHPVTDIGAVRLIRDLDTPRRG
ncbi:MULTISPECIES: hypothetical protein [unclassified Frankia]|uniref:hypothetical protein n=1 Tax=unclassified Frankia TaxID=2632575 RepID=UPI002AD44487|nr:MULTISPECIES: hypothetical protein [unclassified Frankia]